MVQSAMVRMMEPHGRNRDATQPNLNSVTGRSVHPKIHLWKKGMAIIIRRIPSHTRKRKKKKSLDGGL